MNLLSSLDSILQESIKEHKERGKAAAAFVCREQVRGGNKKEAGPEVNLLAKGDNLAFMEYLANTRDMRGKIDMIYIDPPFCSGANYKAATKVKAKATGELVTFTQEAYADTWGKGVSEYLKMMTKRLIIMRELLSDSGCIYIHLDWHIVHYIKVLADTIFGAQNFLNEIIWQYKSGGAGKRHFGRKHDTILLYAKTKKYCFYPQKEKSYNRDLLPYHFKGVQEFQDRIGWYTLVNMRDVWPIDMVGRTSGERVDYATQKPEALLERMIQSCTKPGDICADFFAGSGTLASAAEKMQRRWVCCDSGDLAVARIQKRLCRQNSTFDYYEPQAQASSLVSEPISPRKGRPRVRPRTQSARSPVISQTDRSVKIEARLEPSGAEGQLRLLVWLAAENEHVVDHWSIDYDFGGVYSPKDHFFRDRTGLVLKAEKLAVQFKRICVKVTDILGGSRYEIIEF